MPDTKGVDVGKIKEHLTSAEGDNKLVVLFGDSVTKKKRAAEIGNSIKKDPTIVVNRNEPFRIQNNMLILGERKVILGLKDDEKYLVGHYPEGIIRYYEEPE
jgi:hypothetical protein